MRVVLDTNVLISGIFFSGPPTQILHAWRTRKVELALSTEILAEYQRVGERLAQQYPGVEVHAILGLILQNAELIQAPGLAEPVCRDPDDDKFLACALASKTNIIVSGDGDLLAVSGYHGIQVLTPKAFVTDYLDEPD